MASVHPLSASLHRGFSTLVSRRLYITMMVIVPLLATYFFIDLMNEGLPDGVPVAVVDLDHSSLSRTVTRNLSSGQLLSVRENPESFHSAMTMVRKGSIFGFFLIPENFERDALNGSQPTLSYYSNMTYFVPGTLAFKQFKTTAVLTQGGLALTKLQAIGMPAQGMGTLVQPLSIDVNGIGNPWMNYSIYLCQSFIPCLLALMVMLLTCWTICSEIKQGTSVEWLTTARGSIFIALLGKLLPQWMVFTAVGFGIQAILFGFCHFPIHNHVTHMLLAMALLVLASQSFAVFIVGVLPNLRLSLSICSLIGILSFSVCGISFPVESMYGGIGVFSYIIPFRYYFLIYVDQALNGIAIYYSRWFYVALLCFPPAAMLLMHRIKRHCLNPVYVR